MRPFTSLAPTTLTLLASSLLALPACTEDAPEAADTDAASSAGTGGDSADSEDESEAGGTSESGEDTEGGSGEVPKNEPARGISITRVEANSAIAIAILDEGRWVEGSQRTAQIPKNRNTAFRVYVDVDEDQWVTRDIEGRFTVTQADGTESVYKETVTIGGDSSTSSLQSNILFGVLAEDMQPGAKFQVELYEASTDYESLDAVDEPPRALDEPNFIGIETGYQNMKIMLVPIQYGYGSCNTTFDTSEEVVDKYRRQMFQQNPLENIEIVIHDPYPVTDLDLTDGNDFFQLLGRITQLRASESPPPNVYYYGIFDNCGDCIGTGGGSASGCLLGVANGTPPDTMSAAPNRAAIGVQYLGGSEVGIDTFVHEVGHSQGRNHVACPGTNAAGPDITYPHADGKIGTWGFGVEDFEIRGATTHNDYMSYCNPTWVSDWQWKATYQRIRTLSSWDDAGVGFPELEGSGQLVGMIDTETGESQWFTTDGTVDPRYADDPGWAVDFMSDSGALDHQQVDVQPWSEGPWVTVRAPLPERFDETSAVRLSTPTLEVSVDRQDIVVYHGRGLATPQ